MAIAYRGRAQVGTGTASATVVQADFDVAPQAGDLLVAVVTCWGQIAVTPPDLTTPTGWTSQVISRPGDGSDFDDSTVNILTRPWSSSDTSYVFAGGGGGITALVIALSGADTANPNGGTSTNTGLSATAHTVASVTAAAANCLLVAGALNSGSTTAYSSTGTMTQRATASQSNISAQRSVAATQALTSAGATGTRTFTAGVAGTYYGTAAIAIREAVAVVTPTTGSPGGGNGYRYVKATDRDLAALDDDLLIL